MNDKTIVKLWTITSALIIVIVAFMLGYNGNLALYAIVGLFGGEKLLNRLLIVKFEDNGETKERRALRG